MTMPAILSPPASPSPVPRPRFGLGVNLPWRRYGCDFGTNAWRMGGVSVHDCARIRMALDLAAARGAEVVRWFVLCDGRSGIDYDGRGVPARLQSAVADDLGRALDLAGQAGLRLVPVLFDFHWGRAPSMVNGVQLGGRTRVLVDTSARQALHEVVVRPLVSLVGDDPRVALWDLCNEPEWLARGVWPWRAHKVSRRLLRRWLAELAGIVRAHSRHPVTVGLASAQGLDLCTSADVDVVQVHWYDRVDHRSPLGTRPAPLRPGQPVVLGEFPTAGSTRPPGDILETARAAGYDGAWAWSLLAQDSASSRDDLLRALAETSRDA
jgi:hypothetical protein